MTRPILLLCNTRSGSTAFGHALADSNSGFTFGGEIFNPAAVAQVWSFPFWLTEHQVSATRLATDRRGVLRDYLSDLLGSCPLQAMVLDVKYHDLPSLLPTPALASAVPIVFELVAEMGGVVLHLVRRDKARAALSEIAAVHRVVFHLPDNADAPVAEPITVDREAFIQQVRMRALHETLARQQLALSECRALEIAYEDVFSERQSEVVATLGETLAMPITLNQVRHRRLSVDYEVVFPESAVLLEVAKNAELEWPVFHSAKLAADLLCPDVLGKSVPDQAPRVAVSDRLSMVLRAWRRF